MRVRFLLSPPSTSSTLLKRDSRAYMFCASSPLRDFKNLETTPTCPGLQHKSRSGAPRIGCVWLFLQGYEPSSFSFFHQSIDMSATAKHNTAECMFSALFAAQDLVSRTMVQLVSAILTMRKKDRLLAECLLNSLTRRI